MVVKREVDDGPLENENEVQTKNQWEGITFFSGEI